MASLPSTSSIVDYLNSTGQDSSFSSRRSLFNSKGLNKTLGDFQGSASQNTSLLNSLRSPSKTTQRAPSFFEGKAPPNAFEASNFLSSSPTLKPFNDALQSRSSNRTANTTRDRASAPAAASFNLQDIINQATNGQSGGQSQRSQGSSPTAQEIVDRAIGDTQGGQSRMTQSRTFDTPTFGGATAGTTPSGTPAQDAVRNFDFSGMSTQQKTDLLADAQAEIAKRQSGGATGGAQSSGGLSGMSASEVLGNYSTPSEGELVDQFLNSTQGKLEMEKLELKNMTAQGKADAAKQALETKYSSEKEGLENRLAANGLAFSGIRGTQVKALADSLATSVLGVDREFATKLLDADINFRETILDGVSDLIKAAADDKDDAIKQLNAAGYAVVGDQLVPTLARQNATADDIRADANLAIAQKRLDLSIAADQRAASKASSGGGLNDDWNVLLAAIQESDDGGITPEQIKLWGLQNTDLSSSELDAFLDTRPDNAFASGEATRLVFEAFDQPGIFSRLRPGSQTNEALVAAKQAAIKATSGVRFNSPEEKRLAEGFIESLTLEQVKAYKPN